MFPSLNYVVLTNTLVALKEGNFRYCETLGFTFDELNTLNQLSLDELFIVSRASAQFMSITVRHDALKQILALSRKETQRQQQINRAIRLGGSIALLNHFFGLTSNEVCARRQLLGITVPYGRKPIPDDGVTPKHLFLATVYSQHENPQRKPSAPLKTARLNDLCL
ncbi:DUF2857 domain-containing protein [Pectobacterium versatile]|uniref:DUF2857 domain-containing protein n=1 Tax=Pectobacterium versatile TaxID=2488639 RepID=UPI0038644104